MLTSIRPPDAYRPDTIVEMRRAVPGVPTPTDDVLSRDGAYLVRERTVPGPDGDPDVALLACLPRHARTPVPAIYFIHGGGMIVGNNRFGLPEVLDLAEPLGMAVVSVEYRLAPETPHPGPVEDSYAGLRWPRSPGTRSLPARRGCTASWTGEWTVQTSWHPAVRGRPCDSPTRPGA
ncbi:alpha/beta hydrolase [Actinoplanes sp. NPDC048796]|uniref:alpha/beta hydrolase n=1 Tax=Actinoplanes sp. NPDC048796 TaxID=3155640 RepID=UPI0033C4249F